MRNANQMKNGSVLHPYDIVLTMKFWLPRDHSGDRTEAADPSANP